MPARWRSRTVRGAGGAKPQPVAALPGRRSPWLTAGQVLGWALLGAWGILWVQTWLDFRLALPPSRTWIERWPYPGLDFLHNHFAVRGMLSGENPYQVDFGDFRGVFSYPPVVLVLFSWSGLLAPNAAVGLWAALIALSVSAAAWISCRWRRAAGLIRLPPVLTVALVLWSLCVLYAMERGAGDAWILLMILGATWALRRRASWWRDLLAGTCLAVAAWTRIYPALLIPGLFFLRARRAMAISLVMVVVLGVVPWDATRQWFRAAAADTQTQGERVHLVQDTLDWLANRPVRSIELTPYVLEHSLPMFWLPLRKLLGDNWLARMPGPIAAALVLLPLASWVSYRVYRSPARDRLAYPYLLWLAALATFWMPLSNDYNLFFLPLAAIAVWDRRDGLFSHVAMGMMLAWLQPFRWPLPEPVCLYLLEAMRIVVLGGVAWSLLRRAGEAPAAAAEEGFSELRDGAAEPGWRPFAAVAAALGCVVAVAALAAGLSGTDHFQRGMIFVHWQQAPRAIDEFTLALARDPTRAPALAGLGMALSAADRLPEAWPAYEQALRLDPASCRDVPEFEMNLALSQSKAGRAAAAIAHYRTALEIKPDHVAAHVNLGLALEGCGRMDEAIAQYREALKIDPEFAVAHNNLGVALAGRGQVDEAMAHYREALKASPDYAEAHTNLGIALARHGRAEEAIAHYREALRIRPDFGVVYTSLGIALAERGQFDEAIACYRTALGVNPGDAETHFLLAGALSRLGKEDEAKTHLRQALDLAAAQNNHALAEAVRTRLNLDPSTTPPRKPP